MSRPLPSSDAARVRRGLLLVASITLVSLFVFFLDVAIRATVEGERITVLASAAPGLGPGSAVWVAGRPVGRVLSVGFRPPGSEGGNVVIEAVLGRGVERYLRADATVEIRPSDLLEPVVVAIDPGTPGSGPRNAAGPLRTAERPIDRDAVLALADTLLESGRRLAEQTSATRAVLQRSSGSFQRLRAEPEIVRGIRAHLDRIGVILTRDYPTSSLARLASDTIVGPAVNRLRGRLDELARSPGRAGAERAASSTSAALDDLQIRVAELARRLEGGEGTAGRALADGELARQIEVLRGTLRALTEELIRYPSRWLRVRVF